MSDPRDPDLITQPAAKRWEVLYTELHRLAAAKMAREPAGHTLQTTALVHEAWLRLKDTETHHWHSRAEFFSAAAEAMRRILIERARRKRAIRHGGRAERVLLDEGAIAAPVADDELLAVDEALDRLAAQEPKKAELVKLRYFGGFTLEEAAEVLAVSHPTAKRYWAYARAWLYREIRKNRDGGHASRDAPTNSPPTG